MSTCKPHALHHPGGKRCRTGKRNSNQCMKISVPVNVSVNAPDNVPDNVLVHVRGSVLGNAYIHEIA